MQTLTKVIYGQKFEKQLYIVPQFVRKKVLMWVFAVEQKGIWEVAKSPGLHDEPLKGVRLGLRSIRINRSYRLIYKVLVDRIYIELIEVHKHDY